MSYPTTIVSGFIDLNAFDPVKRLTSKSVEFYLEKGRVFLEQPVPKVVFVEERFREQLRPFENETTRIYSFEKEEMDLWGDRERILQCQLPVHRTPEKDTHDYMIVQHQKFGWLKRASELNPFGSQQFVWSDYGIVHILHRDPSVIPECYRRLTLGSYKGIRIPGCWRLDISRGFTIEYPLWYLCGGVMGGDADSIARLQSESMRVARQIIASGRWTWEVNTLYLVALANRDLFLWYEADHNPSMMLGYAS